MSMLMYICSHMCGRVCVYVYEYMCMGMGTRVYACICMNVYGYGGVCVYV